MKISIITVIAVAAIAVSCVNPVVRKANRQLDSYRPDTAKFKNELARQLTTKPEDFTYHLERYFVNDGHEYLTVNIKRDNFVTTIPVLVKDWAKIEGIKRTKGMGYKGAELRGLKLALVNATDQPMFVYNGLEKIVD